jgi:hypothetical protein
MKIKWTEFTVNNLETLNYNMHSKPQDEHAWFTYFVLLYVYFYEFE